MDDRSASTRSVSALVRILVTGGAGFVGSNVVAVAAARDDDVAAIVRTTTPLPDPACRYVQVDLLDAEATRAAVEDARPDAIVHTAILNDLVGIYANRRAAWESYVGVTRTLASAANDCDATLLYVSTDWVFDGGQSGADESTPPNPINYYGVLKAASELVTVERARKPIVARIAGVMGTHRAEREVRGIFHCCGGESTTRVALARQAARAFDLDESLIESGPPDQAALPPAPIPYDTSLDARMTARALERELPSIHDLLREFRNEREQVGGS